MKKVILTGGRGSNGTHQYKKIEYEDDIVVVYDKDGEIVYKGLEDYEPDKDAPWRWDEKHTCYRYGDRIKRCLAL